MKINKSNEMELVGKVIVNNKGQKANVIEFKNEKYVVEVEGKQKEYAIASLKRNWEIEEEIVENDNKEDVLTEEQLKTVLENLGIPNATIDEDTLNEEIPNENIPAEEENKVSEDIDEDTLNEEIPNENIPAEKENEVLEDIEEDTLNEEIPNATIAEDTPNEEIPNEEENKVSEDIEEETENTSENKLDDNRTRAERAITGELYGIPVKYNKINQTTIWKILNKIYNDRKVEKNTNNVIEIVKKLKSEHPTAFAGAYKCLVAKCRMAYIDEVLEGRTYEEPIKKENV